MFYSQLIKKFNNLSHQKKKSTKCNTKNQWSCHIGIVHYAGICHFEWIQCSFSLKGIHTNKKNEIFDLTNGMLLYQSREMETQGGTIPSHIFSVLPSYQSKLDESNHTRVSDHHNNKKTVPRSYQQYGNCERGITSDTKHIPLIW